MIPDLPEGIDEFNTLKFYDTLSGNLSDQSTVHTNWHTHRSRPSMCWICDMTTLLSKVLDLAMAKYTKSSVDSKIEQNSEEEDSDTEIENSLNHNDEPSSEPEYDVVEEQL